MVYVQNIVEASTVLDDGEFARYVEVVNVNYTELKQDFQIATHFADIDQLQLLESRGVYIHAANRVDALLAAQYIYRKYVAINGFRQDDGDGNHLFTDQYEDGAYKRIPVLRVENFIENLVQRRDSAYGHNPYFKMQMEKDHPPYWIYLEGPLILETKYFDEQELLEAIRVANARFLLFVKYGVEKEPAPMAAMFDLMDLESQFKVEMNSLLFQADLENYKVKKARLDYYVYLLQRQMNEQGYEIDVAVSVEEFVELLIRYRKTKFSSNADIDLLTKKIVRKKSEGDQLITENDFQSVFNQLPIGQTQKMVVKTGMEQLEQLIGLTGVKEDVLRIVKKFKFIQQRKEAGFLTTDFHLSCVFMGDPGTAKTTIARILGKILLEEGVLTNSVFRETSRKDFVGQYVGWTAPQVAKVFADAKGGVLFIDEAYSIFHGKDADAYSYEAMAEIIQQMENNPDTLVIFAGYTDEMQHFIHNANPGLRSRLTTILLFSNYEIEEMIEIFHYFIQMNQYKLEDKDAASHVVRAFIEQMQRYSEKFGNGRMMRKLFSETINHVADRQPEDLQLILTEDIENATAQLLEMERRITKKRVQGIGFWG